LNGQLEQDTQDSAVDYREQRRSKADIETKNVVLQLAAKIRGSSGTAAEAVGGP